MICKVPTRMGHSIPVRVGSHFVTYSKDQVARA